MWNLKQPSFVLAILGAIGLASFDSLASIPGNVLVVDCDASTNGDGSSWLNPYNDLQDALDEADNNDDFDQVWVKASDCFPVAPSSSPSVADREVSFLVPAEILVYGSFEGIEDDLEDRDLEPGERPTTTLSGDIDTSDPSTLHSFHVLTSTDDEVSLDNTLIDGFVIRDGIADGPDFVDKDGAGATFDDGDLDVNSEIPEFRQVWFLENEASDWGGGVYAENLEGGFYDCVFERNVAERGYGGGIAIEHLGGAGDGVLRRCDFKENEATKTPAGFGGGAVWCKRSGRVYECRFWNNFADGDGGAILCEFGDLDVVNGIFAENECGGTSGGGGGGAINCQGSGTDIDSNGLRMTNCLVVGNSCETEDASAIASNLFRLVNCTVADNETDIAAGAAVHSTNVANGEIQNSIIYFNESDGSSGLDQQIVDDASLTTDYCCVTGIDDSGTNIDEDPEFFSFIDGDPQGSNFRLDSMSPCLDVGDSGLLPDDIADLDEDGMTGESLPEDLDGLARVQDDGTLEVDMGAYEGTSSVCLGDITGGPMGDPDGLVNVSDLLFLLAEWGPCGADPCPDCDADLDGDCVVDVDDLLDLLAEWGACDRVTIDAPETVQECYDLYSGDIDKLEACLDIVDLLQGQ